MVATQRAIETKKRKASEAAKREFLQLLELREKLKRRERIKGYYPEKGLLRRELYVPHMRFFEAGGKGAFIRAILAANRVGKCCDYGTLIDMWDGSRKKIGETKPGDEVVSWDGGAFQKGHVEKWFNKSPECLYRIWLSSGRWFDIAGEHRFLTKVGWFFFSDLQRFLFSLPPSTSDTGLLESFEDVCRYLKTNVGFQSYCQECFRLCGERPPFLSDTVRCGTPSQVDVLPHTLPSLCLGDLADINIMNFLQFASRRSSIDAVLQVVIQLFGSSSPTFCSFYLPYRGLYQESQPLSIVEAFVLQSDFSISHGQSLSFLALESPYGLSDTIIGYQPIGVKDVFDIQVGKYQNYLSNGVIHHNSEGIGAYEVSLHATGRYPEWWVGKRFLRPPATLWAAGKTNIKTRDVCQEKLLGPINDLGTGMIPYDNLIVDSKRMKAGVPNAIESIGVNHVTGLKTNLVFKSYAEGRESFEGEKVGVIWLDEETDLGIFGECVLRVTPTIPKEEPGHILCTFTPLEGMSEVVMSFIPDGRIPDRNGIFSESGGKFVINATWDDAPHLSKKAKDLLWAEIPPYQREARTRGIPQLGSGAIYPISEEDVTVEDFEIPVWYKRAFGFDHGWNNTAAVWGAYDDSTDILYVNSTYKRGMAEPPVHAASILSRGDWIPGVSDPSKSTSSRDGAQLVTEYQELLPALYMATKSRGSVEAGIFEIWKRLSTGRLKVFKSCRQWLDEFRLYRRDDKGRVVEINDHLMDATRYLVMDGLQYAISMPDEDYDEEKAYAVTGRNKMTGY